MGPLLILSKILAQKYSVLKRSIVDSDDSEGRKYDIQLLHSLLRFLNHFPDRYKCFTCTMVKHPHRASIATNVLFDLKFSNSGFYHLVWRLVQFCGQSSL